MGARPPPETLILLSKGNNIIYSNYKSLINCNTHITEGCRELIYPWSDLVHHNYCTWWRFGVLKWVLSHSIILVTVYCNTVYIMSSLTFLLYPESRYKLHAFAHSDCS